MDQIAADPTILSLCGLALDMHGSRMLSARHVAGLGACASSAGKCCAKSSRRILSKADAQVNRRDGVATVPCRLTLWGVSRSPYAVQGW